MKFQRKHAVLLVLTVSLSAFMSMLSADSLEILKADPTPRTTSDSSEAYLQYLQQLAPSAAGKDSKAEANIKGKQLNATEKVLDKTDALDKKTEQSLQPYDFIE